tara:strand:- start:492 stop:1553 length:1062 start_codon:yes stop_codon:yes gene_type:complete
MLLDDNFVMQGGVRNYLGKTKEVKAPKYWKSSKDSPKTELAYITEAEKGLLIDANLHGSLKNGKPNVGAAGLLSYDGWGDSDRGTSDASYGGGNASGDGDNRDYGGSQEAQDRSNRANELTQARKAAAVEQARAEQAKAIAVEEDRQKREREAAAAAKERARIEKGISEASANAVDPGVAGSWSENKKTGKFEFTPSTDTITSFSDNLKANLKSSPFGYLTPTSTMLATGIQTLTANAMMGNLGFNVNRGDRGQNNNQGDRGEGNNQTQAFQNQLTALAPYLLTNTVAPKSQVLEYFSNKNTNSNFDFAKDYASAKSKVSQTLNNRGSMGMLAVTDSPYYDWLKTKNLDKGIL